MATYAFDDEPTLTSAKVTGTNTVTLEFSEELVGGSTDAFVVSTNGVSNTVSGYTVSGSTVTLTLGTDVQPGDETQVSYVSSTATLKDVDEGGKTVSITDSTVATYAFDDEPTLTSAKVTGTNTVTLEFSEELVGGSTNAFAVSTNGVSNTVSGYTVSGSTVTLTLGTDVQPGDETQVSYVSSTATLKDVDEGGKTVSITDSTVATYAFDDEPTLTSAKVTGTNTVTLEFSEELVGGSTNAFAVSTNGVSNTVSGYTVSGSTVTLTLGTDVQPGDETQVSYVSSTATLKDVDEGGKTVSITDSTVATYAFDDEPTLTSAKVTGTNTVTLEFSEELVGGSTNAFAVSTNGVSNTVSGYTVSGSTVTLTLGTDVQPGDETQVSYVSSTATLKDVDEGGKTVSITDSTVATYAFDDEPTLTSAKVTGTNTVTLEFSEELVGGSTNAFVVSTNGVSNTVSGYTVSGSTVTLTLGTDVQPGDETQVSYVSSTATLKDVDEGGKTVSITDSTVATYAFDDEPTLTSAKVTGTNTVTLEFSEELVGGSTNAFAVSTNGVSNTVSGYTVSGSTVTLTLGTDVQPGDETQVSYVSSTATLKDVDEGGKTVSITDSTVATYAFDDEPTLTSAKVTGTNTVTLEFSEELVGGSTNAFAVSTNGVSNTVSGYTVSGSTVTLTLGTDVQPGDETQVSYVSSTATLKDVDEGGKTVSITDSTVATYAFDDEPTLTSAKVTGTNTVTLEFSEELVGGSTNAFVVSTNGVSNTVSGYTVSGSTVTLTFTDVNYGDDTQVSYVSSTATEGC